MDSVIKVKELHKIYRKYEEVHALKGISFEVYKGEILGFVGPNGAGKTGCMKILSGFFYETKGYVHVLGFYPFKREKEFLKRITFKKNFKRSEDET